MHAIRRDMYPLLNHIYPLNSFGAVHFLTDIRLTILSDTLNPVQAGLLQPNTYSKILLKSVIIISIKNKCK